MTVKTEWKLKEYAQKKLHAAELYAHTCALKMEGYAKENRPWQDQTGNAKNSIQGTVGKDADGLTIYLSGNTDYFVFLELGRHTENGGFSQYPILQPTVARFATEVRNGYKGIFR